MKSLELVSRLILIMNKILFISKNDTNGLGINNIMFINENKV